MEIIKKISTSSFTARDVILEVFPILTTKLRGFSPLASYTGRAILNDIAHSDLQKFKTYYAYIVH
jgi:hypothetical protein